MRFETCCNMGTPGGLKRIISYIGYFELLVGLVVFVLSLVIPVSNLGGFYLATKIANSILSGLKFVFGLFSTVFLNILILQLKCRSCGSCCSCCNPDDDIEY